MNDRKSSDRMIKWWRECHDTLHILHDGKDPGEQCQDYKDNNQPFSYCPGYPSDESKQHKDDGDDNEKDPKSEKPACHACRVVSGTYINVGPSLWNPWWLAGRPCADRSSPLRAEPLCGRANRNSFAPCVILGVAPHNCLYTARWHLYI